MNNEELANALNELAEAYKSSAKSDSLFEDKKKDVPWICTVDGDSEVVLKQFAEKYSDDLEPFEYEDAPILFECEEDDLNQAKENIEALRKELADLEGPIEEDELILQKKIEELDAVKRELDREKSSVEKWLAEQKEQAKRAADEEKASIRSAYSQSRTVLPSPDDLDKKFGCGKTALLLLSGFFLASIVLALLEETIDLTSWSSSVPATALLMLIQVAAWFTPYCVALAKKKARVAAAKAEGKRASDTMNEKIASSEKNLALQIAQLENDAEEQRKNSRARQLQLEEQVKALEAEGDGIKVELDRKNSIKLGIEEKIELAAKGIDDLRDKYASERTKALRECQRKRAEAYREYVLSLRPAFEDKKEKTASSYASELDKAKKEATKNKAKLQECLVKTTVNGKPYPLDRIHLAGKVAETIKAGNANSWEEAIKYLETETQKMPIMGPNSNKSRARNGFSAHHGSTTPHNQAETSRRPSRPGELRPSGTNPSPTSRATPGGGRRPSDSASSNPRPSSGASNRPAPKSRPSGGGPSGRPRPTAGNGPTGAKRRRGTPKDL